MENSNQDTDDLSNIKFDIDSFRGAVPWYVLLLLRFWPSIGVLYLMRLFGMDHKRGEKIHKILADVEKVDIHPLTSASGRGFMLTLDRDTALYFYQDGDAFRYDGFEYGEYIQGNVRIFDGMPRSSPFPAIQRFGGIRSDERLDEI